MSQLPPKVFLARHGQTEWSITHQHTGLTDIPLTSQGEVEAKALAKRLLGETFSAVFTSPLQRARRTCELAGFGDVATVVPDLAEWDYGRYDGLTTKNIQEKHANWNIFRDGAPEGESVEQISQRADRVIQKLMDCQGQVLLFAHGHFIRVLAARWMEMSAEAGRSLALDTASLSILHHEHEGKDRVIRLWNQCPSLR